MKKLLFFAFAVLIMTACTITDYSVNTTGASDYATVVVKDFITVGIVTVQTTETHYASALGFKKRVEGSNITFSDLMQEAAKLEADDIINVRIDTHANYTKGAFDWLTGWTRTYTHTGTALAIKYTDRLESVSDPQLGGLPKSPEKTRATTDRGTAR